MSCLTVYFVENDVKINDFYERESKIAVSCHKIKMFTCKIICKGNSLNMHVQKRKISFVTWLVYFL